jgi:hypothetical protein
MEKIALKWVQEKVIRKIKNSKMMNNYKRKIELILVKNQTVFLMMLQVFHKKNLRISWIQKKV